MIINSATPEAYVAYAVQLRKTMGAVVRITEAVLAEGTRDHDKIWKTANWLADEDLAEDEFDAVVNALSNRTAVDLRDLGDEFYLADLCDALGVEVASTRGLTYVPLVGVIAA